MSIAAEAPETDQTPEIDGPAPVILLRAAADSPAETSHDATGDDATGDDRDDRSKSAKLRDWYSGWCGPGPCHDGRFLTETGEPRLMCKGFARNGEKAGVAVLYCACTCHHENPAAVQTEPAS